MSVDAPLRCDHPRHLWMLSCWLGWNPDRDGGRWETCWVPRPLAERDA
jgi:hypothetical protein